VTTILVVDDEPIVLEVVVVSLQREGYEVVSATSVGQAIEIAISLAGRMALVIVNHSLGVMPGQNLVEAIERLQPGVKVLRFSGHSGDYLRTTGQITAESAFLQKPFTTQEIRKKVRDIIGPPPGHV